MTETCGGCVFDGVPLAGVQISLGTKDEIEPGRITISGNVVASGYRLAPQLTELSFASGQFQTQDTGNFDSTGLLQILGRLDDVVIVGGVNVALSAVESLIRDHPLIKDVAVVDIKDDMWGSIPIAHLVTRPEVIDTASLISEIQDTIRNQIGSAAVPRGIYFATSLPMLDSGKIDRISLRLQTTSDNTQGPHQNPGSPQ